MVDYFPSAALARERRSKKSPGVRKREGERIEIDREIGSDKDRTSGEKERDMGMDRDRGKVTKDSIYEVCTLRETQRQGKPRDENERMR